MQQELQPSILTLGLLDVADVRWSPADAVQTVLGASLVTYLVVVSPWVV